MSDHEQVRQFVPAWSAAEQKGDTTDIGAMLADDFTAIGPLGFALSKQDWLDRHASGALTYERFELDEMEIRGYGDAAVVVGRQASEGAYQGHPVPGALRTTLILAPGQSGAWRLVHIHMSFIAGTPGAPPIPGRP